MLNERPQTTKAQESLSKIFTPSFDVPELEGNEKNIEKKIRKW